MSGDVQPRKRKDKKKKKETSEEIPAQSAGAQVSSDDVNIHVHKENATGGEFCAKCIFFIVMAVIAVVIGLAIVEYRGQTDLDAFSTESRFAPLFEGWIDKSQDNEHENDIPIEHSEEIDEEEEKPNDVHEGQEETDASEEDDATSQPEDDDDDNKNLESEEEEEEEADEQQEELDEEEEQQEDEDEINQAENASEEVDEEKDENDGELDEDEETQNSILDDLTQTGGVKVLPDDDDDEAESESDGDKATQKKSGAQSFYTFANITNENDYVIRDDLDDADRHLEDE